MRVAYHFTIPEPPRPELDAAIQDALKLKRHYPGELNYLYPGKQAKSYIPRAACGWHQRGRLADLDAAVDVHQVYSNGLYPYPILTQFRKPIVYTSITGLGQARPPILQRFLRPVHTFVTTNEADQQIMQQWQFHNVEVVHPGIDLTAFSYKPCLLDSKFVLMVGSAPWSVKQFQTKGVDLLLDALAAVPDLHLVMLWRGVLFEEMQQRVQARSLAHRVEIINEKVDVNTILARVHASVVLASEPSIIKAYPHSLLESLAAGKPVLVSDGLPMADYVAEHQSGRVVSAVSLPEFLAQLTELRHNYARYQHHTHTLDLYPFSEQHLIEAYGRIYRSIL